jgi:SAM-dependent methyltransferase
LCRTYINGKVKHINKCLYIYHLHGKNSFAEPNTNKNIQTGTIKIYDKYIESMVNKWCCIKGLRQVTLKGDGVDRSGTEIFDVRNPERANISWPFEDESVGVFHANQTLPYFNDPIHAMREIHRCLAPQGWLLSTTPSTDGRGAFMNPLYKSYWNANSFLYYTNMNFTTKIGEPVKFQCYNMNKHYFPEHWYENNDVPFVSADLIKIPPHRTPGVIDFIRPLDESFKDPDQD